MKKYEYLVLGICSNTSVGKSSEQQKILNEYGEQGWELVSIIKGVERFIFYFKREVK